MKHIGMDLRSLIYRLIVLALLFMSRNVALAQRFTVESFKLLPNDVSAFINPVNDLNDVGCGLIKVIASNDFVFATPLGIVKRADNVGEIWLYVPKGTKKITVKHAQWGVLRDYILPQKIDSHMSYEMRIREPISTVATGAAEPVVKTTVVTDTLIVTRVDTLMLPIQKKAIPFEVNALLTGAYGGRTSCLSGGILLMAMKRNGGFVHVSTDFGRIGQTVGCCDRYGYVDADMPFYSGKKRHSVFMINAGGSHRLSDFITIFEGVGYSSIGAAWQLAASEGGGYVKNSYFSQKGLSFELGLLFKIKNIRVSSSVVSIKGKDWYGSIGIGLTINKH